MLMSSCWAKRSSVKLHTRKSMGGCPMLFLSMKTAEIEGRILEAKLLGWQFQHREEVLTPRPSTKGARGTHLNLPTAFATSPAKPPQMRPKLG